MRCAKWKKNWWCVPLRAAAAAAAAQWLRPAQTHTSTQSYGWIWVVVLRYSAGEPTVLQRGRLDFTPLWLDRQLHDRLMEELSKDVKCNDFCNENLEQLTQFANPNPFLLCQTCPPSLTHTWADLIKERKSTAHSVHRECVGTCSLQKNRIRWRILIGLLVVSFQAADFTCKCVVETSLWL